MRTMSTQRTKIVLAVAGLAIGSAVALSSSTPALASGTNLWAKVAADGSLVAGSNVASSTSTGPGTFEVTFNRNVAGCAYVATTRNSFSQAVQVFTASGHASVERRVRRDQEPGRRADLGSVRPGRGLHQPVRRRRATARTSCAPRPASR